jgi:hypothetical protein
VLDGRSAAIPAPGTTHVVLAYLLSASDPPAAAAIPLVTAFLNVEGVPLIEQIGAQSGAPVRFLGVTFDAATGLFCAVARPEGEPAPAAEAVAAGLPLLIETLDAQTFASVRDRWRLAAAKGTASLAARATALGAEEVARSRGRTTAEAESMLALTERDLAALAPQLGRERCLAITIGRGAGAPPGAAPSHPTAGPPAEDP